MAEGNLLRFERDIPSVFDVVVRQPQVAELGKVR
jgi:hypothetical protein